MSTTRGARALIRIAAIEVSHWHSLDAAAYLRHLAGMPDVQLVGLQDPSPEILAHRAAALGQPATFTDYRTMLIETRPDFVMALGRKRGMAETAHYLLDRGAPPSTSLADSPAVAELIDRAYTLAGGRE